MTINKCPFCNSENTSLAWKTSRREGGKIVAKSFVRCRSCYARGPVFVTEDVADYSRIRMRAVECWNGIPPECIITTLPKRGTRNV